MSDDDPPQASAKPRPVRREERVSGARRMLGMGYAPDQVLTWLQSATADKPWRISRQMARITLDEALETMDGEVSAPKNRKQARTRAMLTLVYQRAMSLAVDDKHTGKAAALLNAAVAAADRIARIDGSYEYDGSTSRPEQTKPATIEDALRVMQHASSMMELATKRGALPAATQQPPPVIDATAEEVEDEPPDTELPPPGHAN